jgi:hypothetical protein
MKLLAMGMMGAMVLAAMSVGCGPGLSHREAKAPESNSDVFNAMDAELSRAMIGTTTVTSGDPLPESRLSVAPKESGPVVAAVPTWGAAGEMVGEPQGAGAAPVTAATAVNDFDMHPYDKPAPASFDMHPYD